MLAESLSDETTIKISLFSFVSETRHKQEATEEQLAWKNRDCSAETPDRPDISNGTSPYHHKDTAITLSNNNVMLTIIIIIIIAIYFVISLYMYHLTMKLHRI